MRSVAPFRAHWRRAIRPEAAAARRCFSSSPGVSEIHKYGTRCLAPLLGALGLVGQLGLVVGLGAYSFFLVTAGLVLLVVATLVKNL